MIDYSRLLAESRTILTSHAADRDSALKEVCCHLQKSIDYYNWVGFYFANFEDKTLHLKAFAGIPTEHTIIPFGKGICGQVALSNESFLVEDVMAQDNYIACDINVKSELVVPLFVNDKNIGQIDIDSNTVAAFTPADTHFLIQINTAVAEILF